MAAEEKESMGTLHHRTLELLGASEESLMRIANNAGVPYFWLRALPSTKGPSVNRVQKVYEYLAKKPLL